MAKHLWSLKRGLLNRCGHLIEVATYLTWSGRILEVAARRGTWAVFDGSSSHEIKPQALHFKICRKKFSVLARTSIRIKHTPLFSIHKIYQTSSDIKAKSLKFNSQTNLPINYLQCFISIQWSIRKHWMLKKSLHWGRWRLDFHQQLHYPSHWTIMKNRHQINLSNFTLKL